MDNFRRLIRELNRLAEEMDQTKSRSLFDNDRFDSMFEDNSLFTDIEKKMNEKPVHHLLFEVIEEDKNVVVVVDLPGFEEDDISLTSDERHVRVDAEAREDMRRESVSHTFELPVEVVPDEATATFENGVLSIMLPRVEPDDDDDDDHTTINIS